MKKIILSFICLFFISAAFAQTGKMRVAIAFNTDTNFSLLGPLSINSLEIDLTGNLYKQIELLTDTSSFQLKRVEFPEELSAANNPASMGIPKKSLLTSWIKKLNKKEAYDLLLIIYKPIELTGPYASLLGLSYGLNTRNGVVFSLNNALVFNTKTMQISSATSIESESDYIAGTFELDKNLPYAHRRNVETPIEMINKLNQEFALKVFQCLQIAKRKMVL